MAKGLVHGDIYASFVTNAALANPFVAVKLDTGTNNVNLCVNQSDLASYAGITGETSPLNANEHVAVKTLGYSLVQIAGTVTKGAKLTVTTAGKLIATTTSTDKVIAIALDDGANGDIIEARLLPVPVLYSSL